MSKRDAWSMYKHLGYLYAAVATSGGRTIGNDEFEVMSQKLYEWNSEMSVGELLQYLFDASRAVETDAKREGWHEKVAASRGDRRWLLQYRLFCDNMDR